MLVDVPERYIPEAVKKTGMFLDHSHDGWGVVVAAGHKLADTCFDPGSGKKAIGWAQTGCEYTKAPQRLFGEDTAM